MAKPHIVFDIETVPDYRAIARANGVPEDNLEAAKAILGDEFPKLLFHKIVCISALGAVYTDDKCWRVREWASIHIGDRSEKDLVGEFLKMIDCTMPVLVSFNGIGFDLPVVQARSLLHRLSCFHLPRYKYTSQFSDLHIDLCNELGARGGRLKLDEACRAFGLPGKLEGVDGASVAGMVATGQLDEIADYCADDVAATYRLFLLRELYCGRLTETTLPVSVAQAEEFLNFVKATRPGSFVQS